MRIGQGYDVHRLTEGRPLILGGIPIPFDRGLLGHSDADVLIHAIADALLGAAAMRDIGYHFPDTSEHTKDMDSRIILRKVVQMLGEKGYRIVNIDATIIAQQPKLSPYITQMQQSVAEVCGTDNDSISIKATTTERLGFTGREEGIATIAVALIDNID